MNKYEYSKRKRKFPRVKMFADATILDQNAKVWEEMSEYQAEFASVLRKEKLGTTSFTDIKNLLEEGTDVLQAMETFIHVAIKHFGRHYGIAEGDPHLWVVNKNKNRGYYGDDE